MLYLKEQLDMYILLLIFQESDDLSVLYYELLIKSPMENRVKGSWESLAATILNSVDVYAMIYQKPYT